MEEIRGRPCVFADTRYYDTLGGLGATKSRAGGSFTNERHPMNLNPNREVLYVGKAEMLRNRLQRHAVLETISEDLELDQPWDRLQVSVWYLPTQNECKAAEASLIRVLKPRYNAVDEGEDLWTLRPPDLDAVDYLTLRPETRQDIGEPCPIEHRTGIYIWYLISEQEQLDSICEVLGWEAKNPNPDTTKPSTTPTTSYTYRNDLEDFASFLGAPGASEGARRFLGLSQGDASGTALLYQGHMTDRGLSPATIARRLAAIRSLVKCARILGQVSWTLEVETPKVESYLVPSGPGHQGWLGMLQTVKERASKGDAKPIRDVVIIRLLHDLGLGRGELVALDYESVDRERGTVTVVGKRRRQAKVLSLPESTMQALSVWLEVRGSHPGPLFTRLDKAIGRS